MIDDLRGHLEQCCFEADYARAEDGLRARLASTAADDAWLQGLVAGVAAPDEECARAARARFDAAAMPLGGLGLLQEDVQRLAAALGTRDVDISARCLVVFLADNGVVAQGVSQSGQEVTAIVANNLLALSTSSCRMAACAHAPVIPVDVGMATRVCDGRLRGRAAVRGTRDITRGPALTRAQALLAVREGYIAASSCAAAGARLLAAGEMGIGNTTTTAALACVLAGIAPDEAVGRGAGLDAAGLERKRLAVARSLEVNDPCARDVVGSIAAVGGCDIAAMCGFYLGAASCGVPVVLDGVISCVAALCAQRLCPQVAGYMLASHVSQEPAARVLLDQLGLRAPIAAGMHLGEGTGAMAVLPLLDAAVEVYRGCITFEQSGMDAYKVLE